MNVKTIGKNGIRALVALMIAVSLVTANVGAATQSSGSGVQVNFAAEDTTAGASTTHKVVITNDNNSTSLNGVEIDYAGSGDVSDVGVEDIEEVGARAGDAPDGGDTGSFALQADDGVNTTIEGDFSSDLGSVSASNNGTTLTLGFSGSLSLFNDDEIVVVFSDAVNPDTVGDTTVTADINPQSSGTVGTATLTTTPEEVDTDGDGVNDSEDEYPKNAPVNYTVTPSENESVDAAFVDAHNGSMHVDVFGVNNSTGNESLVGSGTYIVADDGGELTTTDVTGADGDFDEYRIQIHGNASVDDTGLLYGSNAGGGAGGDGIGGETGGLIIAGLVVAILGAVLVLD